MESFLRYLDVYIFQALDVEVSKLEEENQKSEELSADLNVSLEQCFGLTTATCSRWIRVKLFFSFDLIGFVAAFLPINFYRFSFSRLTLAITIGRTLAQ